MTVTVSPHMGIPVHHHDLATSLGTIEDLVADGRRTGRSHQVVTVNTDFLVQARKHADVHAILRSASLAVADGMPLVWASAVRGQPLPTRVAGADLVPALATRFANSGQRITFFGGGPGVAERAAVRTADLNPGLQIQALAADVGENSDTDPAVLDAIRCFDPDVLCVALGHPKQERWIRRHGQALRVPVAIGVGGTFDFIAGERHRAPRWVQRYGLEWLYRMSQEPSRLTGRYLTDIAVYVPCTAVEVMRTRLAGYRNRSSGVTQVHADDHRVVIALRDPNRAVDSATAAELISLVAEARTTGRRVELRVPSPRSIRSLTSLGLDRLVPLVPIDAANGGRAEASVVAETLPPPDGSYVQSGRTSASMSRARS